MPQAARCQAALRDGSPCRRVAVAGTPFCPHHQRLEAVHGAESLKRGLPRRRQERAERRQQVAVVETQVRTVTANGTAATGTVNGTISPAEVRPRLAQATAESLTEIQQALLDAALGATREHWVTFTCPDCGKKHRAQVDVPDVRARISAVEVLLREGLGRPAQAEEVPTPQLSANVAAVKRMGWEEMQFLLAATYVDEIAAIERRGGVALLQEKLAALSEGELLVLREALEAV